MTFSVVKKRYVMFCEEFEPTFRQEEQSGYMICSKLKPYHSGGMAFTLLRHRFGGLRFVHVFMSKKSKTWKAMHQFAAPPPYYVGIEILNNQSIVQIPTCGAKLLCKSMQSKMMSGKRSFRKKLCIPNGEPNKRKNNGNRIRKQLSPSNKSWNEQTRYGENCLIRSAIRECDWPQDFIDWNKYIEPNAPFQLRVRFYYVYTKISFNIVPHSPCKFGQQK